MDRITLHIIDGDSRSRAEQARLVFALGHHAEVYAELEELLNRRPCDGVALAKDNESIGSPQGVIARLVERGFWLPVLFTAFEPQPERVVDAIKAGAIDYLALPLDQEHFGRRLDSILAEAGAHGEQRRRVIEAQGAIALLSRREHQVLEFLSLGCSNKEIGRLLEISPRTVEIHRGNMMTKLGADHVAEALRLWMESCEWDKVAKIAAVKEDGPTVEGKPDVARHIRERRDLETPRPLRLLR